MRLWPTYITMIDRSITKRHNNAKGMLKSVVEGRRVLSREVTTRFSTHSIPSIAERGGSRAHAVIAKYFGRSLGSRVDGAGRTSINYATKSTRVAVNQRGKIITYIRYTSKWWRF